MAKKNKRIMVMGAGGTAGINFIASLRKSNDNYFICGCDINKWHLEIPNVDKRYVVPYSIDPGYIDALNEIIQKEKIDFIHAQPDMEVEVLSENRERIEARQLLPAKLTIRICRDKMKTNEILRKKKNLVPLSYRVNSIADVKDIIETVKQASHQEQVWIRAIKGAGSKAALPVKTFRQAKEWIHYWRSTKRLESKDFMISEYLPGREFAFQSLWYQGKLVVSQARERLEYLMGNLFPSGQSSSPSVAVTVHNNKVNTIATKAVLTIDKQATGIFCVDLKENSKGIPCVTEINAGRFFTTSNFFAEMGCNMPDYYIKMGLGEAAPKVSAYNALPAGFYWIRSVDSGPVIIKEGEWKN